MRAKPLQFLTYARGLLTHLKLFRHPQPQLQFAWNCTTWGLLLLSVMPPFGALALLIGAIALWCQEWRSLLQDRFHWVLGVLGVWLIAISSVAANPGDSWLGLGNFLPFFLLFAAWSRLIQTPHQLRQIGLILVFSSIPVSILGCGQLWAAWAGISQLEPILGWILVKNGEPLGRMSSTFMHANTLGAYLQLVFILGLGLWIEARDHLGREKIPGKLQLIWLSIAVILDGVALVFTNSRNAWAIAALACLVFALYRGWVWLVGLVAGMVGAIAWSAFGLEPGRYWLRKVIPAFFWARLTNQMYPDQPLALQRTTQWQFAWDLTLARPWTGWGLRNFTALYLEKTQTQLNHPHNLFLMLTAETGIPTTLLFLGAIAFILARAILILIRQAADRLILFTYLVAFTGLILFNTVDVSLFDFRVNTLGWLILAAIWGVVRLGS
ncbi:O-antigen ligase family protein [Merismopedia glauca]|uniref:Polymerase n=1 Tax=Merismopedia glauca CCAP 1448/3 TaxID=1296344 RepID=A0A2T1C6R5_9CYAN|nr:O-antigen ligase family protein [Merismopedia glauca]PSB03924.1 polymerase [Merismopedia glauca CCAP 1448/3]